MDIAKWTQVTVPVLFLLWIYCSADPACLRADFWGCLGGKKNVVSLCRADKSTVTKVRLQAPIPSFTYSKLDACANWNVWCLVNSFNHCFNYWLGIFKKNKFAEGKISPNVCYSVFKTWLLLTLRSFLMQREIILSYLSPVFDRLVRHCKLGLMLLFWVLLEDLVI